MPKLFTASRDDTNTPFSDTQAYFDRAPQPKQLHIFDGSVHGVRIFATDHGDELRQLLLSFITTAVPA